MPSSETLLKSLPPSERKHLLKNDFPYIHTKASHFLKVGPAKYRKADALGEPSRSVGKDALRNIKAVCSQLVAGHGFSPEKCISRVSMEGLYAAMQMFHFEETDRQTTHGVTHNGDIGALDSVTFTHVVKHTTTQVMVFYPYEKPDFDFEDDEPTNSPPSTGLLSKDAGDLPPILLG